MQCIRSLYTFLCCVEDPKYPTPYNFSFGKEGDRQRNLLSFQSNFVRTSKYRWYDFIPKSLLLQFRRLANIYFLIISVLQSIPVISPLGPLTAWAPLIFVLAISIIRQGYEDYQRYKSDISLNFQMKTQIYQHGEFNSVEWSEVKIGDIVKVQQGELIPADLILLSSSIEGGNAFIKTASLDGQNNLKPRNAYPSTQKYNSREQLKGFNGQWWGTPPFKQLQKFSSKMNILDNEIVYFKNQKQLLYRGSSLQNTKWIFGLCIYTGRNTKIMLNSDTSSQKMSQIEVKVNYVLAIILVIQIIFCAIIAILNGIFINANKNSHNYIEWSSFSVGGESTLIWCTYFVLLNTMIPISLIVSIEMVKVSQSYFINKDKLMFSSQRDKGVDVRSASLNEQLGQIQYVFTDKTGTLTMNKMQFKIAVIGSKIFGDVGLVYPENHPLQNSKTFQDVQLKQLLQNGEHNDLVSNVFAKNKQGDQHISFKQMKMLAEQFMTALAVTHQVVVEVNNQGSKIYQGPSPDQITLVEAAKIMKFQFQKTTQTSTHIKVRGESRKYQLLQTFPFNSNRKRMSVIIRSHGMIKMYIKGADSMIKSRLAKDNDLNLDLQLSDFSKIGLRTLLIGMRIISEREYNRFKKLSQNLSPEQKEQSMNSLVSELQQNIYLIGATAVLDRLQDQVPETIRDLIKANIKVWMLTGDKMQTAENIAKSCNLIQKKFAILRLAHNPQQDILLRLIALSQLALLKTYSEQNKALIIQGDELSPIIGNFTRQAQFAKLTSLCQTVVCCRMLPIQKAEVVRIVRTHLKKITLSIGDGSNDVPMIKTAHIGVGLYGQQGMGSVQASDYALPQFRMLWRLLFVHGRWNYIRISEMILYFFYKNMLFTIPQFIFAFYCGYSGQTIFDDVYISLYNLFFTSLPLVIRAILEQDVYYIRPSNKIYQKDDQTSSMKFLKGSKNFNTNTTSLFKDSSYIPKDYQVNKYLFRLFPKIYFIGQKNYIFNYRNFFIWIFQGVSEAVMITLFGIYIFSSQSLNSNGYSSDLWMPSLTIFTAIVLVVTFKLAAHTKFWSVILFICIIFFSLGLYFAYMWVSNYFFSDYITGTTFEYFLDAETYFAVLFCICIVLWIDGIMVMVNFRKGGYASRMRQLIKQQQQNNKIFYKQLSIRSADIKTHMAEDM